jgi:hypothetical protein
MRTMIATMLLPLLALVGVEVFTRTPNVAATPVTSRRTTIAATCRVDGIGRLRIDDGQGEQTLAEPQNFNSIRNGGLTAYAARLASGLELLVCSEMGNVVHRASVPDAELGSSTAVMNVQLLSATKALVALHVNPSTELGVLIDLQTGEHKTFEGYAFTPSPDGHDVAYFREPPHGTPAGDADRAAVYINGRKLAEVPRDSGVDLRWQGPRALTASVRSWNGEQESYDLKPF